MKYKYYVQVQESTKGLVDLDFRVDRYLFIRNKPASDSLNGRAMPVRPLRRFLSRRDQSRQIVERTLSMG